MKKQTNLFISEDIITRMREAGIKNLSDLTELIYSRWLYHRDKGSKQIIERVVEDINLYVAITVAYEKALLEMKK